MDIYKNLINLLKNAYAPYSRFKVAAIIETEKGLFNGVNVENVSYGATICAERNAMNSAITYGAKQFKTLYITCSQSSKKIMPCALCLQVLSEFCKPNMPIIIYDGVNRKREYRLKDLYPHGFCKTKN